ncbi:(2Fe-2S)-binding protein [Jiella pelagia]|uniref:(2Fe-2S)-binding protein n=1 Tax=Jiella pelagia TaxID=2986949 RepID=A0ABY7BXQ1_9HYPH|nr:(2Fe-2S)-binding protein [Jiella pelagia]WAP68478.1 (2Fe-2S)-binding protein [Jiella pelagia]
MSTEGRILRLAEEDRPPVDFVLDGRDCRALFGDTVLTAVLSHAKALRHSEFGPEGRAGFCLMGACQDCWMWQESGPRIRACSTPIAEGMRLMSMPPREWP